MLTGREVTAVYAGQTSFLPYRVRKVAAWVVG